MAQKSKAKLKWMDKKEIAFRLIDLYPSLDPRKLSPSELVQKVHSISDFGDKSRKPDPDVLEEIQELWYEERSEMEDELGPVGEATDESLDEDEYAGDRMVEDMEDEDREESALDFDYEEAEEEEPGEKL